MSAPIELPKWADVESRSRSRGYRCIFNRGPCRLGHWRKSG